MLAGGGGGVEVGGEASRPGAGPVSLEGEVGRVGPVIEAIAERWPVAIDTRHETVDGAGTVLINLWRGAGLDGRAAVRPGGRHPILGLRRVDTEAACAALGWQPVTDPSNQDPRFVRNRIRHELLPLMNDISDRDVVPLLVRTSDIAHGAAAELEHSAASLDPTDARQLARVSPVLAAIRLRQWLTTDDGYAPSTAEIDRVLAVVRGEAVACQLSRGRTVRRSGGVLRLET